MKIYAFVLILIFAAISSGCENGKGGASVDGVTGVPSNFAWDGFKDSEGNTVYGCRNVRTQEFVDNSRCNGPRNDDTWPN